MQKKIILIAAIAFTASYLHAEQKPDSIKLEEAAVEYLSSQTVTYVLADSIINYSKMFLNTPYRYGSNGNNGFDCSGFTSYVYRNFGYNLPRTSASQAVQYSTIPKTELLPGDLVFFQGRKRNGRVGHVGIVTEPKKDGTFDFIHASVNIGVTITNSQTPYYSQRFVKAARVVDNPMEYMYDLLPRTKIHASANTTQKTETKAQYHTVKPGETLSSVAKKNKTTVAKLKKKNGLRNNNIRVGQRLKVGEEQVMLTGEAPKKKEEATTIETEVPKQNVVAKNNVTSPATHTVKNGESLFRIAKEYDITVEQLKGWNQLESNSIKTGQQLIVKKENGENSSQYNNVAQQLQHTVKKGESLYSISKNYGCSVDNIKSWNNKGSNNLKVGESLIIFPNSI